MANILSSFVGFSVRWKQLSRDMSTSYTRMAKLRMRGSGYGAQHKDKEPMDMDLVLKGGEERIVKPKTRGSIFILV